MKKQKANQKRALSKRKNVIKKATTKKTNNHKGEYPPTYTYTNIYTHKNNIFIPLHTHIYIHTFINK